MTTMLERLMLSAALGLGCTAISGCATPQRTEYAVETETKDIAERTVTYLEQGKADEAMNYLEQYDDRKCATMSYLRAITLVAKAGPPDATNFLTYITAGNHFESFFGYIANSPGIIEQDEIPDRLFELSIYKKGKKGLRAFVQNPGRLWWWHIISKDDQKKTLSNCYATLPAMELVEGNYGNCARALKLGLPHFLPERCDRMREAIDNWYVFLVRESAMLPTNDPRHSQLELRIKDVERMQEALKVPDDPHKATLNVIEQQK